MTEIAISIRTENDRRSLTASIRVSAGGPAASAAAVNQPVEQQLGVGPLLPEGGATCHPATAFAIHVGSGWQMMMSITETEAIA
ncbi:MAG: hypothetical protein ACREU6_01045 [Steroidobacteraceae bacterium]